MDTLQQILRLDDADKSRLEQSGIKSINDFIDFDSRKLSKIMGTDIDNVKDMKLVIQNVYRVETKRGFELLEEIYQNCEKFLTQIPQVDEILPGKGFYSGDIIEITGPPSAGKTTLLYTFMMNILDTHEDIHILFIDMKYDFSAVKLKKLLTARGVDELKQVQMMKRIQVDRAKHTEDLIKTLQYIYDTPLQHEMLKFIMIDSITVPFYFYIGRTVFQLCRLTQASELMRLLGKQNKAVNSEKKISLKL